MIKVELDVEDCGIICDALDLALSTTDEYRARFWGMEEEIKEIIKEIEKQSGCVTHED